MYASLELLQIQKKKKKKKYLYIFGEYTSNKHNISVAFDPYGMLK